MQINTRVMPLVGDFLTNFACRGESGPITKVQKKTPSFSCGGGGSQKAH